VKKTGKAGGKAADLKKSDGEGGDVRKCKNDDFGVECQNAGGTKQHEKKVTGEVLDHWNGAHGAGVGGGMRGLIA